MKPYIALLVGALAALSAVPLLAADLADVGDDVRDDARLAGTRRVPMLLLFATEHCRWCTRVEEEFLKPMLASGRYDDRVLIRRVDLERRYRPMADFDGSTVSVDTFARRYRVVVTPTLVFLDPTGAQLAPKLVGLTTPDFYGGYIDERIEEALGKQR